MGKSRKDAPSHLALAAVEPRAGRPGDLRGAPGAGLRPPPPYLADPGAVGAKSGLSCQRRGARGARQGQLSPSAPARRGTGGPRGLCGAPWAVGRPGAGTARVRGDVGPGRWGRSQHHKREQSAPHQCAGPCTAAGQRVRGAGASPPTPQAPPAPVAPHRTILGRSCGGTWAGHSARNRNTWSVRQAVWGPWVRGRHSGRRGPQVQGQREASRKSGQERGPEAEPAGEEEAQGG